MQTKWDNMTNSSRLASTIRCRIGTEKTSSAGFTLVEMLISVAMVLLIMTMFAEIFQIASSSLGKQRGLAENDQRARMISTVLRGDLDKRTFRDVTPFTHLQDTRQIPGDISRRAGYWYYAENDPTDDTDDVLQFTANVLNRSQNTDTTPFVGRAIQLPNTKFKVTAENTGARQFFVGDPMVTPVDLSPYVLVDSHIWIAGSKDTAGVRSNDSRYTVTAITYSSPTNTITVQESIPAAMFTHGDCYISESQPELDDGLPANSLGQSTAAEISYFLRGGNLYRRLMLIRPSYDSDSQPHYSNGQRVIGGNPGNYVSASTPPRSFLGDQDYSAYYYRGKYALVSGTPTLNGGGVRFHSLSESLTNDNDSSELIAFEAAPSSPPLESQDQFRFVALGIPQTRFGHDPWTGLPREFALAGGDGLRGTADDTDFLGRFTMLECANAAFGYPGSMSNIPAKDDPAQDRSPVSMTMPLAIDPNTNLVTAYSGTPQQRRGEDIVMSNVIGFDVKVWDSAVTRFVDVGDAVSGGSFEPADRQNTLYSPNSKFRYDTWHPRAEVIEPVDPVVPRGPAMRDTDPPFSASITAVQITINYRDISSDQVRQVTVVQSLVDPQ